jgi:hypothetical protein
VIKLAVGNDVLATSENDESISAVIELSVKSQTAITVSWAYATIESEKINSV